MYIDNWKTKGFIVESIFDIEEMNELRLEIDKFDQSIPYKNPHIESKLCDKIMCDDRILKIVETIVGSKVDAIQTWLYFKPPGELGRDVHQDSFYLHGDWGSALNASITIDDADEENGGMYYYEGSHRDKYVYPIPDNWKDEERIKTNPEGFSNERGKPNWIPGSYTGGEWIEKYNKVFTTGKSGDTAFVHSHVLHGSGENKSKDRCRRSYIISYIAKNSYYNAGTEMDRKLINVYR